MPPANHDRNPWESNAGATSLMDDDDMPLSARYAATKRLAYMLTFCWPYSSAPKINMDMASNDAPVDNERPEDRQAALLNVQSALLSKGPASNLNRRQTRGRRDVNRASMVPMASNDDIPLSRVVEMQQNNNADLSPTSPESYSTPTSNVSPSTIAYPTAPQSGLMPGRSMSVLSASSSLISPSTAAGGLLSNPSGIGLRALITESVNVLSLIHI